MRKEIIISLLFLTLIVSPSLGKKVELGLFTTYSGGVDKEGRPSGKGTIIMKQKAEKEADSYILKIAGLKDELSGLFSGNTVENATIKFASDWEYSGGTVIYTITTKENTDFISYKLIGGILSPTDGNDIKLSTAESCIIIRSMNNKETSVLLDSCFQDVALSSSSTIADVPVLTFGNTDGAKFKIGYGILSKGVGKRVGGALLSLNAEEKYEKWELYKGASGILSLADGTDWTYSSDDSGNISIHDNKGNTFRWDPRTNEFKEIVRCYEDGIAQFVPNGESHFLYANGDNFTGTCDFYSVNSNGYCSSPSKVLQNVLQAKSIYECYYMIRNGVFKFNGKEEMWNNGLTNYQAGKIAGNYDKVVNEVKRAQAMDMKAKKSKWLQTKETLKGEFEAHYVDVLFNYQLVKDMPLELFQRAKQLGAPFDWQGPITVDNTYDVYVITMYNMETGEVQYQRILRFSYLFHRLCNISTTF